MTLARKTQIEDNKMKLGGYTIFYSDKASVEDFWQEIFVDEEYRFDSQSNRPTIIDCGSHVGLSILYFKKKYPNAKILGFEADPNNFKILQKNIEVNHIKDVQLFEVGLSNTSGTQKFYGYINIKNPVTLGNSFMKSWGQRVGTDEINVKTERLSNYITERIDFLKLNIEGSEQQVMEDLFESGKISNIKEIYLQYHQTKFENTKDQLAEIILNLKQNGFEVVREDKELAKYLPIELKPWVNAVNPSFTVLRCKQSKLLNNPPLH